MTEDELIRQSLDQLGAQAVALARTYLQAHGGSQTLQDIMSFFVDAKGQGRVTVPYYWAHYVHDGRPPISLRPGEYLIFFPDKRDDPRTDGGENYPVREFQARTLSSADFQRFDAINRQRRLTGGRPIMIVTRHVKAPRASKIIPFFAEGLKPLGGLASAIIPPKMSELVQDLTVIQKESATGRI